MGSSWEKAAGAQQRFRLQGVLPEREKERTFERTAATLGHRHSPAVGAIVVRKNSFISDDDFQPIDRIALDRFRRSKKRSHLVRPFYSLFVANSE